MRYNIIVGARPNFIKLFAFMNEAKNHPEHTFKIIHTGQHYDHEMSQVFFKDMNIPIPNVMLKNETLDAMVSDIKEHIGTDPVIVFGDTRSALAGALATVGTNRLIHIEAGLRSFDSRMPEETNRIVIDRLSDLLFTTEQSANMNLISENYPDSKIKYVGNLMLETLEHFYPTMLNVGKGNHIVATIHRLENEIHLRKIMKILSQIDNLILVIHPGTKQKLIEQDIDIGMQTIDPLGYLDFMNLIYSSKGVITDSGGIQEEANYLNVPCATIRNSTERPSTLRGSNRLFNVDGLNKGDIMDHLNGNYSEYVSDFPDNKVAERIFKHL